jgi:hypothetical protein
MPGLISFQLREYMQREFILQDQIEDAVTQNSALFLRKGVVF